MIEGASERRSERERPNRQREREREDDQADKGGWRKEPIELIKEKMELPLG